MAVEKSTSGTLYGFGLSNDNYRSVKIAIAAELSGFKLQHYDILSNKAVPSEFQSKLLYGKVPVLETPSGLILTQSDAIAEYVCSPKLLGEDLGVEGAHLVRSLVCYASQDICPLAATISYPSIGITRPNDKENTVAAQTLLKQLSILDGQLESKTFLVGERLSLADITLTSILCLPFKYAITTEMLKPFTHLMRWFKTVVNQPSVQKYVGKVEVCERPVPFNSKMYEKLHQSELAHKKQTETKKAKEPAQPKKVKEQPAAAAAAAAPVKSEKKADIFASLPPTKFNFEDWKRVYSNKDTRKEAMPWLWENLDRENVSFWLAEYQLDDTLTKPFMACNYMSCMFRRVEVANKVAFASFLLFGEENDLKIKGVWMWRGQGMLFDLHEDLNQDASSFKFTKLEIDDEKNKQLIEDYFAWEGDFGGLKVRTGDVFK